MRMERGAEGTERRNREDTSGPRVLTAKRRLEGLAHGLISGAAKPRKWDVAEAEQAPLSLEQAGDGLDLRPLILCNLSALDLLAHIKAQIQRIIVAWLDLSTRSVVRPNITGHAALSLGDELDRSDQLGRLVPVF